MVKKLRIPIIIAFALMAVYSLTFMFKLNFQFDFESFFPKDDPELAIFKDFIKDFETDDNFLLIGLKREEGIFDQKFLTDLHDLTIKARDLPHVLEAESITKFSYPLITPFGVTAIPAIHIDDPSKYPMEREKLLEDERLLDYLVSRDGKSTAIALKTVDAIRLDQSKELLGGLEALIDSYDFEESHLLGRAVFQKELVRMQVREILVSTIIAGTLVFLIMLFIYRRALTVAIALTSIGLGMTLFMGYLGISGQALSAMTGLYPILMIIVGTSDVIHIMSKYLDELEKGNPPNSSILVTIKEIGLATLLTSVTTAVGFTTLLTSKITPIREFGVNAAVGVMIAYVTVVLFTSAVLSFYDLNKLTSEKTRTNFWNKWMTWAYKASFNNKAIWTSIIAFLVFCGVGISMVTTNYKIESNLPIGAKITKDYYFFEDEFVGFRPVEVAVTTDGNIYDYEIMKEINKVEEKFKEDGHFKAIRSQTMVYKSIAQMYGGNNHDNYKFPETEAEYNKYKEIAAKIPKLSNNILVGKNAKKARVISRMNDVGADSVKVIVENLDTWINQNTDTSLVNFNVTGTAMLLDKNVEYARRSLLTGLAIAIIIVGFLMALLFKNWRYLIIALVPNIFPLLFAGAILGFLNIELEAGITIVFAIIFGIAVDDSIHFLSRFKIGQVNGMSVEESLKNTFLETGKAICITSIILFFGFMVLLFSVHPPSKSIGILIGITLVTALLSDLFIIPLMIRLLIKR
ncbi:efflux RND transporter permease subunit [Portibacter lacus]|uniref:Transporter n=1 Tax=Portibacter lacus TaxID=1099794 RepID=A0AA37SN99_9BACT|nr:MMPL family transporter [Portibacter lacus]GLR16609.1 transporter [Portibacter lacus]